MNDRRSAGGACTIGDFEAAGTPRLRLLEHVEVAIRRETDEKRDIASRAIACQGWLDAASAESRLARTRELRMERTLVPA